MKTINKSDNAFKSKLYEFIWEEWIINNDLYKKVNYNVILNQNLSINDKAIYLAILRYSSFTKDYNSKISNRTIFELTGIKQPHQPASIKKLVEAKIIRVIPTRYENRYALEVTKGNYLPLKLEQFNSLKVNKKKYIRRLTAILLSNGNDQIPIYSTCLKTLGKLTRGEYKKLQAVYNMPSDKSELDITNYVLLQI